MWVARSSTHKDHVGTLFHDSVYFISHGQEDFRGWNIVTDLIIFDDLSYEIETSDKLFVDE